MTRFGKNYKVLDTGVEKVLCTNANLSEQRKFESAKVNRVFKITNFNPNNATINSYIQLTVVFTTVGRREGP